ncbi:hypothetical protein A0H81_04128 [Grifola frondosa]|uniref:Uncharacterized protein n=1 Tax=Grifola frondosa TaxID=5627 RepID=A0A1C7MGF2_GRIFR|nr:hypothetical protein A0H81_04128 [Grifola frondosa]
MSATAEEGAQQQQSNSFYAALARTATRSLALYFSRPVRLFRPSKVSGWHSLRGLAGHNGQALTPQYLSSLVKQQGLIVIPKHFVPPMIVNGALGVVLWSTYTEVSNVLEPHLSCHPTTLAAVSGACAGGTQALLAAPAENMRFALEGTSSATGWSDAWKEVFRSTEPKAPIPREVHVHEARQVRDWMKEVGEMAGRGWDGWGWGCAKDICGFAVFFATLDFTRRFAVKTKAASQEMLRSGKFADEKAARRHAPRIVHAITLVAGGTVAGLAYEIVCRPWDAARKAVHVDRLSPVSNGHSITTILLQKLRDDGLLSFFKNPAHVLREPTISQGRTLGDGFSSVGSVRPCRECSFKYVLHISLHPNEASVHASWIETDSICSRVTVPRQGPGFYIGRTKEWPGGSDTTMQFSTSSEVNDEWGGFERPSAYTRIVRADPLADSIMLSLQFPPFVPAGKNYAMDDFEGNSRRLGCWQELRQVGVLHAISMQVCSRRWSSLKLCTFAGISRPRLSILKDLRHLTMGKNRRLWSVPRIVQRVPSKHDDYQLECRSRCFWRQP